MKRILVVGGGTAGHVFPGLSVACYLMTNGWEVAWLGTSDHIEAELVPKYGIDIKFIKINGLINKKLNIKFVACLRVSIAIYQARKIMSNWRPDVVLGMGGYISGPSGLAAWSYGIPLILHEQNRIAGLTNRLLAKFASKVLQAFPGAFLHADVVGNPVRDEVLALPDPIDRLNFRTGPIRVLVIGGSQGAKILNENLPKVAAKLSGRLILWHQVGKGKLTDVIQLYVKLKEFGHEVVEFIDNMASAYAWADLVICRSGALTVSEIAVVGLPAIFIPFMHHKDYQQYWNALLLEQVGAAKIIEESECIVDRIIEILITWDRRILLDMAQRAKIIAVPDATKRVVSALASF